MTTIEEYNKSEFEERFTKIIDTIKFIEYLKKLDLSKVTDEEFEIIIKNKINIIPYTSGIIPKGSELFRARVNINQEPYYKVEDIYAPPSHKIKKYGRANKPNERVFYCASNYQLAAFEVIQDLKHSFNPKREIAFLTIGVWKAKEDIHVSNIIYSEKLLKLREDILKAYNNNLKTLYNGNLSEEAATSAKMLLEYFAEEFIKENIRSESDYRVSNFYINSLRKANSYIAPQYYSDRFDGINYPSVAMKYKGDNQALFIESADSKLEIINALQVDCSNIDFDKGELISGIIFEAESIINGEIKWKDVLY